MLEIQNKPLMIYIGARDNELLYTIIPTYT